MKKAEAMTLADKRIILNSLCEREHEIRWSLYEANGTDRERQLRRDYIAFVKAHNRLREWLAREEAGDG